jgi:hypothetical protein
MKTTKNKRQYIPSGIGKLDQWTGLACGCFHESLVFINHLKNMTGRKQECRQDVHQANKGNSDSVTRSKTLRMLITTCKKDEVTDSGSLGKAGAAAEAELAA